jgi:transposase
MSTPATVHVGVDVSKDSIIVCGPGAATVMTVSNTPAALRAWLAGLPARAHLICEATGRYHYALQAACAAAAVPLTCVNPAHARHYARSLGKGEKTDAVDAALLRRLGQERAPAATAGPSPVQRELSDLLMVRAALVREIAAQRMRMALLTPAASREVLATVRALRARLASVERALEGWLEHPQAGPWRERVHTLCLAVGVNVRSALALIGCIPELGTCNRRQIAKLAGLAPLPWDSGQLSGPRHIQGGRAPARKVLYQCAVVAARWHPASREHYRQLRARGKPAKVAYVAIARKLLIYLNSLLRPAVSTDAG